MHAVLTRVDTHTSVSVDRERRRAILCRLDPVWIHTSVSVDAHYCSGVARILDGGVLV